MYIFKNNLHGYGQTMEIIVRKTTKVKIINSSITPTPNVQLQSYISLWYTETTEQRLAAD